MIVPIFFYEYDFVPRDIILFQDFHILSDFFGQTYPRTFLKYNGLLICLEFRVKIFAFQGNDPMYTISLFWMKRQ